MNTNIISISEFNERSGKNWSHNNDCEFHGVIPGYVCGWNVEATKDGKIDAASTVFTNDYEEIRNPWSEEHWNDLGISEDLLNCNGWEATGNIVFRGYYSEHYDFEEREEYYKDASKEVEEIWDRYVV
jgi:hypothetical protein